MKNRFLKTVTFILGIFLIVNLSRSLIDLWHKGSLLEQEEKRLAQVKFENEELTREYEKIQTPEYIEKEAREKLGLAREGEAVIILPSPVDSERKTEETKDSLQNEDKPVWQQWVEIILD